MRIGEAFLELMPELNTSFVSNVETEASRAGQRAGEAMGNNLTRTIDGQMRTITIGMGRTLTQAGQQAGQQAGTRMGESLADNAGNAVQANARAITSGLNGVANEAEQAGARIGQQTGESIAEGAADAVRRNTDAITDALGDAGQRAGDSAGAETGQSFGASLKDKIAVAGAAAGLAAGAALTAGLISAYDAEAANDKLAAQLGASSEMAKDFGKIAGNLYSQAYGESIQDVNTALRAVWQNGLVEEDAALADIESVTAKAINLANIMESDYDSVTKAVGQMMKTGLAGDANEAFDLITRGYQQGVDKAGDLTDTLNEYGTQFRKLGLDGADAIGLLSQGLQGGARDADLVADAFKEFSIRATDGSKTSAEGFKALGLDAEKMTAQFAKGGPAAREGLDTVIDRLKAMKDPVAQNAAGVALFGTQWEDLGAAFQTLDVSTAAQSLGDIAGAADKAGQTLSDNASTRIESFKRSMTTAFVEVLGNQVIPKLEAFGDHVKNNQTAYTILAAVIGTITAAVIGYNIAMGIAAAATTAWTVAQNLAKAATAVWTGIQWALNAALTANPIGIVVVAIVALVAAIVLAYKNSETFRNIVQAVWGAIKTAIGAVADWFVQTVWPALKTAWEAIAAGFKWLYDNVIQPVWSGIKTAIDVAWAVIKTIFDAIVAYVKIVGAIYQWLYDNIVKPVWAAISLAIQVAWKAIEIVFKLVEIGIRALGLVFEWIYDSVIKPVWDKVVQATQIWWNAVKLVWDTVINFIKTTFSAAWNWIHDTLIKPLWDKITAATSAWWNGVKLIWDTVIGFIKGTFAAGWNFLHDNVIKPVWDKVSNVLNTGWTFIRDKIFNPIKEFITTTIPNAFSTGVGAIGNAWDKLKEVAKVPVKFVLETVLNNGIIKGVNWLAEKVGAKTISPIPMPFAKGGILPGYTPGRDVHRFVSATGGALDLSGGESIMRPEFTKGLGPRLINWFNRIARTRGPRGVREGLQTVVGRGFIRGGFKQGGILGGVATGDGIGDTLKGAWDALTDPGEALKKAVEALISKVPGAGTIRDIGVGAGKKALTDALAWVKEKVKNLLGSGSVGGWQNMWNAIKAKFPNAQLYSAFRANSKTLSGNTSYHASGRAVDVNPQRAIAEWIKATYGANTKELITPWRDLMLHNGKPHKYSAAIEEQHGVTGKNAHIHWAMKLGGIVPKLFDRGGLLMPGQLGINKLGKPERILTPSQTEAYESLNGADLIAKLEELIEAVREVAPGVGDAVNGAGRKTLVKSRVR